MTFQYLLYGQSCDKALGSLAIGRPIFHCAIEQIGTDFSFDEGTPKRSSVDPKELLLLPEDKRDTIPSLTNAINKRLHKETDMRAAAADTTTCSTF